MLKVDLPRRGGHVWLRDQPQNLPRDWTDHRRRDHIAWKRLTASAVSVPSEWVVDGRRGAAEVAVPEIHRWQNRTLHAARLVAGALVIAEEERLVALNRTAERHAVAQ